MATKYSLPSYLTNDRTKDILEISKTIRPSVKGTFTVPLTGNDLKPKTEFSRQFVADTIAKKDKWNLNNAASSADSKRDAYIDKFLNNPNEFKRVYLSEEPKKDNPILDKIRNFAPVKFLDRLSTEMADAATFKTGLANNVEKKDTGSKLANTAADILGMGLGMSVAPSGMSSANKMISPASNAVEKLVPQLKNPVLNKLAPAMAKGAAEFGVMSGIESYARGDNATDTIENVGKSALGGAAFGGVTKGIGMALPKLKNSAFKETIFEDTLKNPSGKFKFVKKAGNVADDVAATKESLKIPDVIDDLSQKIEPPKTNKPFEMNLQNHPLKMPQVAPSGDLNNRKLIDSIKASEWANNEVKTGLKDMPYDVKGNKDVLKLAQDYVKTNREDAIMLSMSKAKPTAESNTIALELVRQLQSEGKTDQVIDIIENVTKKATEQGQAIQSLRMWGNLTPEGILKYTQKQFNKANELLPANKQIKLTTEFAGDIANRMKVINKMAEGSEKTFEVAKVLADIDEQLPKSIWQKISTIQAMAQLMNPKTINRNIVGNTIFGGLENTSNAIGTPIDAVIGKLTGKRTTILPSITTQVKSGKEAFLNSVKEQLAGVNIGDTTKLDLGAGRTFKKNSILGKLETGLNLTLKSTDEGFKGAAKAESLRQQMKIAGVSEPTEGMIEIANKLAEYRTFQDTNGLSKGFTALKDGLNNISSFFTGTNEWGLGDLVLKYAKTPANILGRAIDYSPAGLVNTLKSLPINGRSFDQKQFVDSLSRVVTGSGLIATGYGLNKLGIITGKGSKDRDVARFEEQEGKRQYSINFDALKRYINSGNEQDAKPQAGDTFTTWDWAAPASIVLGIGANIGQNKGDTTDLLTTIADASAAGINTIFEQPLLSGVKNLTAYGDLLGGINTTLAGIPSSFTPTLGKQISQLGDNTVRSTYDPKVLTKSLNQVKAKVPGLSNNLLPQINTFGEERQAYDSKGLKKGFDILLNPAFSNTYKPGNDIVKQIYEETGEAIQFPRVASQSIKIGKENYKLTAEEYKYYQEELGRGTQEILNKYEGSAPNETTANKIQNEVTKLNTQIKNSIIDSLNK